MKSPRIPRSDQGLIDALKSHLRLLDEYSARAFNAGDEAFYGEVAGKLRLLVYRRGRNRPLLLDLMDKMHISIPITINKRSGEIQLTLSEYLALHACAINTSSRGMVALTNHEFIGLWSQQHGAPHEDWELDEELMALFAESSTLFLGGQPAAAASLRAITNTVAWVGEQFLININQFDAPPTP